MNKPDFHEMAAWLHEHDRASKLEGWLMTNDSDNNCSIARLDDPLSMQYEPGWPKDFNEPKFGSDQEAIEFVRSRAKSGSPWHAQAVAIHDAGIQMSIWIPDAESWLHEQILEHCSPGPWSHGLRIPPFSGDSQPCVYGDERELPLAMLDDTDQEASANVVLLAVAWELCEHLGRLVDAAVKNVRLLGTESALLRNECGRSLALLSRINRDMQKSATERYGEEGFDE
jgi:hypothetical protein